MSTRSVRGSLWMVAVCAFAMTGAVRREVNVQAAAQGVPAPWTSADIGAPAIQGSTTGDGSTFTIVGAGTDIWNSSDQFQFAYQALTGDGDHHRAGHGCSARRCVDESGRHDSRLALRPTPPTPSRSSPPDSGNGFQHRSATGGWSDWVPGCPCYAPTWLRLVRAGNAFTAYESSDGQDWRLLGTETIAMPGSVYVGLAVTSHNADLTALATFSDVTVSSSSAALPPGRPRGPSTDIGAPPIAGSDTAVQRPLHRQRRRRRHLGLGRPISLRLPAGDRGHPDRRAGRQPARRPASGRRPA